MIENEDRDEFREFIMGCGRYEDDDDQDECLLGNNLIEKASHNPLNIEQFINVTKTRIL